MELKGKSANQISMQKEMKLDFEKFVNSLFKSEQFKTKILKGDLDHSLKVVSSNTSYPDLLVRFTEEGKSTMFGVKCKWIPKLLHTQSWKTPAKIQKLQLFEQETKTPIFVVLGYGGTSTSPEFLYVAPLEKFKQCQVKLTYLLNFKREVPNKEFVFHPDRMVLK